ncbi:transcriptional regulator [Gammaproteobacteria bacterium]|nr:transcriptional regulator [Gammaproteobacteria bacterium]
MKFSAVKKKARSLFKEASYLQQIKTMGEYEQALALMDELVEDYDNQKPLIELLASSIERWENSATEFKQFNLRLASLDGGVATLKVLMDQYELGLADLPEIGGKSLVCRVLNGERSLTKNHIAALSKRFSVSPALFFT